MKRLIDQTLDNWCGQSSPKPLVLRGARQVGKSYSVRSLAARQNLELWEVNFEKRYDLREAFKGQGVNEIIKLLEIDFERSFDFKKALIFFDETQSAPEILSVLRYFFEEKKGLRVIVAGSLLDFAFEEKEFSMPVGRVEFCYMTPMTFQEFFWAVGSQPLIDHLESFKLNDLKKNSISELEHQKLLKWVEIYFNVGGMPEAVQDYIDQKKIDNRVHRALLAAFAEDFNKYRSQVPIDRMTLMFQNAPGLVGEKFTYVKISSELRAQALAQALDLLCRAQIFDRVYLSSASKTPLQAYINEKFFKLLMLDVGLLKTALGINEFKFGSHLDDQVLGTISEQFVGQQLINRDWNLKPQIFYWAREKAGAMAEVDYLIETDGKIFPVEVKTGSSKAMKSMQVYLNEMKKDRGILINSSAPELRQMKTSKALGPAQTIEILSLPFYLAHRTFSLLGEW